MLYTPEQIKAMNRTARYKGAVGKNALVPLVCHDQISFSIKKHLIVLDYGAGREAIHCEQLQTAYPNITIHAWDIGDNYMGSPFHVEELEMNKYDIVYASNVFNIQPTFEAIQYIFHEINELLVDGGIFIFNHAITPRHFKITTNQLEDISLLYFLRGSRRNNTLFLMFKPFNDYERKMLLTDRRKHVE
jgi:hypothetical protein